MTTTLRALLALLNAGYRRGREQQLLDYLTEHPAAGTLQIARALHWPSADVAVVLDHLELAGLVTGYWRPRPAHRVYTVIPTPEP